MSNAWTQEQGLPTASPVSLPAWQSFQPTGDYWGYIRLEKTSWKAVHNKSYCYNSISVNSSGTMIPVTHHKLPRAFPLDLLRITFYSDVWMYFIMVLTLGLWEHTSVLPSPPFSWIRQRFLSSLHSVTPPNTQKPKPQSLLSLFWTFSGGRLV